MIQIRQCGAEDFEDVLRLLRQLWPGRQLDREALQTVFSQALASECQVYLCAAEGSRVIGFGSLSVKGSLWQQAGLARVDELVVDGDARGRGVGSELLEALVVAARGRGCRGVELDSAFHRKEAHRFYEKRGFENRAYLFFKEITEAR